MIHNCNKPNKAKTSKIHFNYLLGVDNVSLLLDLSHQVGERGSGTVCECFWRCPAARICSLEEEARQQKQALAKAETEKRQLQEKLTDLEKVNVPV